MRQRDFATLLSGSLYGERNFESSLAPTAVVNRPLPEAKRPTHFVEHLMPSRHARFTLDLDFARAKPVVLHQTIGAGAQFRLFAGRDGDAEVRLVRG